MAIGRNTRIEIMIEVNRKGEVWVFAEQEDGQLHDVSLELCGKARELADRLGVRMGAVLPGANVRGLCDTLIGHGADMVYLVDDKHLSFYQTGPYAQVVVEMIEKHYAVHLKNTLDTAAINRRKVRPAQTATS